MLIILLQVFIMQIVVGAIVVFILKKILDYQLVELAIKTFKNVKLEPDDLKLGSILVGSPFSVSKKTQNRILELAEKKFERSMSIVIKKDKSLKGGMIIYLNSLIIDYSLVGRLKEGGIIRQI
ncbi:MAG: F0F1 ATP synthase subunit delta [Candidatus Omnitrophica bacterium]|nr:F0F1 ATP synthase subunit delta [Candidatus Omnitrophota bacterium]